jgi:hypothetical protein
LALNIDGAAARNFFLVASGDRESEVRPQCSAWTSFCRLSDEIEAGCCAVRIQFRLDDKVLQDAFGGDAGRITCVAIYQKWSRSPDAPAASAKSLRQSRIIGAIHTD